MTTDQELYLHLTEQQTALLVAMLEKEDTKKLSISFNRQSEDDENIRRVAYLDGGRDMLMYLLLFDEKLMAQKEEEKQRLLEGTQPSLFNRSDF